MNSDKYKDFLINNIKPFAKSASGGKVINCRCFYCPDSKDQRKGHFYISVPNDDKTPSLFYCQKCHSKGIVTSGKLIEWGVFDSDIALDITNHNKEVLSNPVNRIMYSNSIYRIINDYITKDDLSRYKLRYIEKRIGVKLSYRDCIDNKIVLNIKDLLFRNHLEYTRNPNIIEQLDCNFVGFLTYDNAFLNMRNMEIHEVYKTINKRYINYDLFKKYDNTQKFYMLPNDIDLYKPIKVHIAEGPFDILSIKYNLYNGVMDNNIYAGITGSGYKGIIRNIISKMGLINIEIHIYADKDVDRWKIVDIADMLYPFNMSLYLHRNTYQGEKDFGVPLWRINNSVEKLL